MTALIFDCDGVLIDSEPLSVAELGATVRSLGGGLTDEAIFATMIGRSMAEIAAMIRDDHGVDLTPAMPAYRDRLAARFADGLRPIPGIADAIAALDGRPRAVASSSTHARLRHTLGLTGLWDVFAPHVYSGEDVARSKPAPDLFLMAADRLGAAPADCVVIEDSPAGVTAAHAAGMRVIGFLGGGHAAASGLADKLPALGLDALVHHARDLPAAVRALEG